MPFGVLLGNPENVPGWERHISFDELVERMVKNDLELVAKEINIMHYKKTETSPIEIIECIHGI